MSFKLKAVSTVVALAIIVGIIALVSITRASTAPDQAGLHYSAGPLSSTKFANCIAPSQRVWDGPADKHFIYPAGQRTYNFSGEGQPDSKPFTVATVDNQELTVTGIVSFKLNTDCKTLRKFHEQIGNKFDAQMSGNSTSDGWRQMLNTYLNQSLQRAMNEAAQGLTWKGLYNDPKTKKQWETEVTKLLPNYIKQAMGGEYFHDFSLTLQKPLPPKELLKALKNREVAVEDNLAQEERNKAVSTEAESIRQLVAILGPEGYNVYQALKDGKVDVMPIPDGSSVVVGGK